MSNSNPQLRIKLLNLVLNDIRSRGWTNYDNFAQVLVERRGTDRVEQSEDFQFFLHAIQFQRGLF